MPIENTTTNRGYQLPDASNPTAADVLRLIAALTAIDVDVATAIAGLVDKASINSPVFTGSPTAPTPVAGDDTNKLATTAYVMAAVASLVNSSPAALDTLAELSAALGNDANFATTVTNALAGKQPISAVLTSLSAVASGSNKLDFVGALGPVHGGFAPAPSAAGVGLSDGDFHTMKVGGVFTINGTWNHGPLGNATHSGILIVVVRTAYNGVWQEFWSGEGRRWRRYSLLGNSWTDWRYLATEMVGTVGQSSGVPTGAIIEYGNNANGEYIRLADGMQICWNRSIESVACETATGALFTSAAGTSWTFPAAFSALPVVSARSAGASARWASVSSEGTTAAGLRMFSTVTSSGLIPIGAVAVGRWF